MTITLDHSLPKLHDLPAVLPLEGAVSIELEQGVPIFRASVSVQERIELLLHKQQTSKISATEENELIQYEEIDDYLSFVNRVVRNLLHTQQGNVTGVPSA